MPCPIQQSILRLEANLHLLKKMGCKASPSSLWETAGHIWGAAYWIGELTKDPKIIREVCEIRQALSHVVSNPSKFDQTVQKITDCFKQIQERA